MVCAVAVRSTGGLAGAQSGVEVTGWAKDWQSRDAEAVKLSAGFYPNRQLDLVKLCERVAEMVAESAQ